MGETRYSLVILMWLFYFRLLRFEFALWKQTRRWRWAGSVLESNTCTWMHMCSKIYVHRRMYHIAGHHSRDLDIFGGNDNNLEPMSYGGPVNFATNPIFMVYWYIDGSGRVCVMVQSRRRIGYAQTDENKLQANISSSRSMRTHHSIFSVSHY